MSVQIHYMDRKGAGCMRTFSDENALAKFCETLRREARITLNGKEIGTVYKGSGFDDPRRKWGWNFERFMEYDGVVKLRCCNGKGGGGRECVLPERHRGGHSFQCGV